MPEHRSATVTSHLTPWFNLLVECEYVSQSFKHGNILPIPNSRDKIPKDPWHSTNSTMARTILSSFSCFSLFFFCFFCSQPLWHQVWLHSLVNIVSPCIYTIIDSLYRCTIILFSISRCTEICTKKMYTILLYSAVVTIPHIF